MQAEPLPDEPVELPFHIEERCVFLCCFPHRRCGVVFMWAFHILVWVCFYVSDAKWIRCGDPNHFLFVLHFHIDARCVFPLRA